MEKVIPHIKQEESDRDARVRVYVNDLSQTKLRKFLDASAYSVSYKISQDNLYLLECIQQQFNVSPDTCLLNIEKLIDASLYCPLKGEYKFIKNKNAEENMTKKWDVAGKWDVQYPFYYPTDYRFSFLDWLSSLNIEFNIDENSISTYVEIEIRPVNSDKK